MMNYIVWSSKHWSRCKYQ